MPRTLDQIDADILAIRAAIANSVRSIHYEQRGLENRGVDDEIKALAVLEVERSTAAAALSNVSRVRQIRLYSNGGFTNGSGNA